MRAVAPFALALLSLPAFASDLDEIKGWRATSTIEVAAAPSYVMATAANLKTWKNWTAWGLEADPEATWEYKGDPNTVGHEMSWDGPELDVGRLVITGVEDNQFTFDLFFGKSQKASKGVFSAVASESGTTVTWDTAGPMGGLGRLLFSKKASTAITADFDKGLADLKPIAEKNQKIAIAAAEFEPRDAAATKAEAEAKAMAEAKEAAKVTLDQANIALGKARGRKDKAAAKEALDAASQGTVDAAVAADAAAVAAQKLRKEADAAKAKLSAIMGSASAGDKAAGMDQQ